MRTVATKTCKSHSIYFAIESPDAFSETETLLSSLGCVYVPSANLVDLEHLLEQELPTLVVLSLEYGEQCALEYCKKHPKLLSEVPVVFFVTDPSDAFDKSLTAIRMGASDVVVGPLDAEKIERIASIACQQINAKSIPKEAGFFLGNSGNILKNLASQPSTSILPRRKPTLSSNSQLPLSQQAPAQPSNAHLPANSLLPATSNQDTISPSNSSNHAVDTCTDSRPQVQKRRATHATQVKELESWILGSSPAMQAVRSIIAEVAETKANVMIYGASGTGKELVATAVHKLSNRRSGPFEPVNMTEIPHDLAESLLFGHEKGSFTGADSLQLGVCEAANGGTLFLDEIGEMALATQPKLLRFLQEGTVKRIGSRNAKKVDVRVITATNRTPETIVKQGMMREDLFFRLHVVPIHIPPLHERPEDIEQLAMLFLQRYVKAYDRCVEGFTAAALDIFRMHDWPGNVRQLENVVERLVVFARGRLIDVADIPAEIHAASMFDDTPDRNGFSHLRDPFTTDPERANGCSDTTAAAIASMSAMQRTERSAIIEALQRSDGHVIDAANLLGLGQATVYRKIKQYHIPHQRRRRRRAPK